MGASKVSRILALSVGLLATTPAFATQHHAVTCSVDPADASSIIFSNYGVQNISAARHVVHCGGVKGYNPISSNIMVATVYDRSVSDDVSCTVHLTLPNGYPLFTASATTSGFGSAAMSLPFYMPQLGGYVEMDCLIPGVDQGQFSHVTTYDIP